MRLIVCKRLGVHSFCRTEAGKKVAPNLGNRSLRRVSLTSNDRISCSFGQPGILRSEKSNS